MLLATDIYKSYNKTAAPVLNGVSIQAERGKVYGIAGVNGSGKSTLLSIITSIVKPDKGSVTIDGKDVFKNSSVIKKHVAYVPQENALFDGLSVLDNIKFWAAAYGTSYKNLEYDKKTSHKKVKTLSGGMKKKLALQIATLNDPSILILDEPTSALDIKNREDVMFKINSFKEQGKAVIFTSHYAEELSACDVLYIISGGSIVFCGTPSELSQGESFKESLLKNCCTNL